LAWRWRNQKLVGVCVLSFLCLILLSPTATIAQADHDDLTGVNVAIYLGAGVMGSSHIALTRMFEWMNASVANITASQILEDELEDFDILVIPGGSETTAANELQYIEGVNRIKDFVASGGSFFGICGGATYGASYVNFFDGSMSPVSEPGQLIHMTTMNVNQSSTGPDLADCPTNISTMYYASQYFNPREGADVHVIATYEYNDEAGMVAFEYENGTVFLSSPHPEYEEDSDRDDTTFGDSHDDPESEWDLLFRVSKWLIEASYVEPSSTTSPSTTTLTTGTLDLPLIAVASTGFVIVVLTVAVLYRRMQ
jgi:glutamine amidotransferase-like uncharacterized protein